jgi:glycosyltransferase involved in cell wall biosynthesis
MKILIVCDHFYPEEFIINDLASEWSNNGHIVNVLTPNPAYPKGKIYSGYMNRIFQATYWNKIKIHRVYTVQDFHKSLLRKMLNYLSFSLLGTIRIIGLARQFDYLFIYQAGPLTQAIPAIIAHKLFRKKTAIWTGDLWPDTVYAYGFRKTKLLSFFLDNLVKVIYKNCNPILIPSYGFQKALQKYIPNRNFIFAPNWCPIQDKEISNQEFSLSERTNFTFAGNVGKVQNLENVILGFQEALIINSEMTLNIIGDGSFLAELKNIAKQRNIAKVNFWGRQPFNEMDKYFNASDFLVISLDPDPVYDLYIPFKFQTYLNAGKPILCVMGGEVAELVNKHAIGIVANPDNIEDIARKFIQCANLSPNECESIKMNSIRLLNETFDREKIIATITNEMITVLEKSNQ